MSAGVFETGLEYIASLKRIKANLKNILETFPKRNSDFHFRVRKGNEESYKPITFKTKDESAPAKRTRAEEKRG
jgi:hypothetical protein